jgi:hypothetical protein
MSHQERLTPRQQEVFSRPRTTYLLVELVRESPLGACCVCWRDVRFTGLGGDRPMACSRKAPGTKTQLCTNFINSLRNLALPGQRRAKAALVLDASLHHGSGSEVLVRGPAGTSSA